MDTAVIEKLKKSLPELENEIKRVANIEIKLEVEEGKKGNCKITSEDLSEQLCGVAAPIFERINFTTWGGVKNEYGIIYFYPKVEYTHYGGGMNGTDYIWSHLTFNANKGVWDFENSRLIYKVVNK